ncbi:MAG: hydroxymethylglutaryl-CoA synthase [Thermoprotei archaeon]
MRYPGSRTGIIGWGTYIPVYRIKAKEIARQWGFDDRITDSIWIEEKAVASADEDTVTMGWYAARSALVRAGVDPSRVGAVFVGTESKPYAVKPSSTIIADALGISTRKLSTDLEFACRAGSEGIRIAVSLVESGTIEYGLAIGSDTAQANPGDVLELTASSGAAAYLVGPANESVAFFEYLVTYVTDTPDFWRRDGSRYPTHGEGFTGEPAYFHHIVSAVNMLMSESGLKPSDFDYAVFHQPNGKFPLQVGRMLGFPKEKVLPGIVTPWIGNTYNASALLGLAKILENSKPGQRILVAPFGSGAGADAISVLVTEKVLEKVGRAPTVEELLSRKKYISYAEYAKFRSLIYRNLG